MRYSGMPAGMWMLYKRSFTDRLIKDLGFDKKQANEIAKKAGPKYKEIIAGIPEFEQGDRFKTNIVNCAMLIAFLSSMDRRPDVEEATEYYKNVMSIAVTRMFCRMGGRNKFTEKDIEANKRTAALRAADRNKYSWNMEFLPYSDGSGYEARFSHCGICELMREYGFFDLTPAMCHLDYTMSEMGGASNFVREYTLATGGPYCDCGYKKK